ncbi:hypothetical protein RO03_07415 [Fusobacterium nucleatum subsp. nucleatum]|uniref:Uncharacterized protein n=1 Tax=Fusobacterium nucleatum subsp. nucleatum TaxID=76856 RepID=A0A0X3Y2V5_FUSNC|nr:hypothetical protein [Fusobacterium nucleatum]KUL99337.1 hypothetical protein RO03_07415 [Fusobacterium nucleatum subsp. nucleatum]
MEKEKVLEIEYQEVFDKIAVRIKNLNDDFFADGLLKEDVEKYNCQFLESPTDLEQRIIWIYDDIYLSDNNINCYCEEKIKQIKEFVDYVNEKYGIPKKWRAEKYKEYCFLNSYGYIILCLDFYEESDNKNYELGNYFKTREEAQKVIDSKEYQNFWAKVRAGEIGGDD